MVVELRNSDFRLLLWSQTKTPAAAASGQTKKKRTW